MIDKMRAVNAICNDCARKAIRSYNAVIWGNDKPKGRETL